MLRVVEVPGTRVQAAQGSMYAYIPAGTPQGGAPSFIKSGVRYESDFFVDPGHIPHGGINYST